MCHRSLANLYEENNEYDVTLFHLKRAGELTKVSGENMEMKLLNSIFLGGYQWD